MNGLGCKHYHVRLDFFVMKNEKNTGNKEFDLLRINSICFGMKNLGASNHEMYWFDESIGYYNERIIFK